jgi:hypothetical protein
MSYRIFRDSKGTEWQAWDVIPRLAERRMSERRARVPEPVATNRRSLFERRVTPGQRPLLSSQMEGGWLCFEAPEEKRRLSPIPSDWINCAREKLEQYLWRAIPARRVTSEMGIAPSR